MKLLLILNDPPYGTERTCFDDARPHGRFMKKSRSVLRGRRSRARRSSLPSVAGQRQPRRAMFALMAASRGSVCRLAALLLAVVVCADVTLDAACDPIALPGPAATTAMRPADAGRTEACADQCVPDCFCCSRSEQAGPALILPGLAAVAQAPLARPSFLPLVARPVLELPPLALS